MSTPAETILTTVRERGGMQGTELVVRLRVGDLAPSDLLAAIYQLGEEIDVALGASGERMTEREFGIEDAFNMMEGLATVLASRLEPDAWRRAGALMDPSFTFDDPQPVEAA